MKIKSLIVPRPGTAIKQRVEIHKIEDVLHISYNITEYEVQNGLFIVNKLFLDDETEKIKRKTICDRITYQELTDEHKSDIDFFNSTKKVKKIETIGEHHEIDLMYLNYTLDIKFICSI